jgi:hypothetical protein
MLHQSFILRLLQRLNCIEDSYKIPLLGSASMLAKACNSVEKKLLSTVPGRLDS